MSALQPNEQIRDAAWRDAVGAEVRIAAQHRIAKIERRRLMPHESGQLRGGTMNDHHANLSAPYKSGEEERAGGVRSSRSSCSSSSASSCGARSVTSSRMSPAQLCLRARTRGNRWGPEALRGSLLAQAAEKDKTGVRRMQRAMQVHLMKYGTASPLLVNQQRRQRQDRLQRRLQAAAAAGGPAATLLAPRPADPMARANYCAVRRGGNGSFGGSVAGASDSTGVNGSSSMASSRSDAPPSITSSAASSVALSMCEAGACVECGALRTWDCQASDYCGACGKTMATEKVKVLLARRDGRGASNGGGALTERADGRSSRGGGHRSAEDMVYLWRGPRGQWHAESGDTLVEGAVSARKLAPGSGAAARRRPSTASSSSSLGWATGKLRPRTASRRPSII